MNFILIVIMYALWSSIFPLGKMLLPFASPIFLTGFRMLIAGFILSAYYWLRKARFRLEKKEWISLTLLGFFSIYLTNILEFWGLKYMSAGKACFIYSFSPFFSAFLSYVHFKEKLNWQKIVGLSIGFAGIIPVLFTQSSKEQLLDISGFISWPALAIIAASFCSVYGWILLRVITKTQKMEPGQINGISMLIGGSCAFAHSLLADKWTPTPIQQGHFFEVLQYVILMTVISNIICYNLYGSLLRKYTATFLSFIGILSPIFASVNSWILLGEPLSPVIFASTAIVSLGLFIVYRTELKQGYVSS
ncbi:MAG: DMT family transporter [Rhabdochlamydiaceae bacterium]